MKNKINFRWVVGGGGGWQGNCRDCSDLTPRTFLFLSFLYWVVCDLVNMLGEVMVVAGGKYLNNPVLTESRVE